ncbi:glycosyl hydrolase [Micromonospora endolithica]|uniref:Uncharacterized protein n=1 Tax=Micromonospora endolithica TaxID=230091 RepID=A0A3A9Z3N1_9ACTN|nr:glycosyl hydrolase [Micromonospora endolithica]RKN42800.1 hypothetical protein D7223_22525 [Micromonospora endolithica]TWJ25345.1 beta-mannanase [Micromonospora endolithica]
MTPPVRRARAVLAGTAAAVTALAAALVATTGAQAAAAACQVKYTVVNDWGSGASVDVVITNGGSTAVNGWTLGWTFPGSQTVGDIWNATRTQSGATVAATNVSWNAGIPAAGGTVTFGFNVAYSNGNPAPTTFTLNGAVCGDTTPTPTTPAPTTPAPTPTNTPTPDPTAPAGNLALNRPVTASSTESPNAAGQAVDGNRNTRWSSLYADPQWIQVDLGATYPINQVTLRWEAAYARAYQLQTSTDGTTWTTVHSATGGDGGTDAVTVTGTGRYVRMAGTARGTSWGYSLWEFEVYAVAPPPPSGPDCGQEPADPEANSKVRHLLCYLKTHSFVSGQTDLPDADRVQQLTGRYPAMVAFDFMEYTRGTVQTQQVIDWARTRKGIVAFQWHWYCPRGGNYAAPCDFVPDLTNPSSKLYQDIDLVIREIKKMGDAGVPVLFRPLHEANNNYMWWAKKGQGAYQQLWRLIYQRAQLAGAHNIVWVFNGMASGQGTSLASWYPGDAYVDMVTSDYFQSASDLAICRSVGTNKTTGVAETFSPLNPATDPAWPYFVVWASRDWNGSGRDVAGMWRTAMADPRTISIDQLPDMSAW